MTLIVILGNWLIHESWGFYAYVLLTVLCTSIFCSIRISLCMLISVTQNDDVMYIQII